MRVGGSTLGAQQGREAVSQRKNSLSDSFPKPIGDRSDAQFSESWQYTTVRRRSLRRKCSTKENAAMKDLILVISQELVDHPEEVTVKEIEGLHTSVLELRVAKDDVGKVIGRQGRTAQSLRTILNAVSSKTKRRMVLEIVD